MVFGPGPELSRLASLSDSARTARFPLPVDELRAFAEVFGAIKSSYVEPVEDKKLITEAISGKLTGLDPHSAYLAQDAFRELQSAPRANSAASASRSEWKKGSSRSCLPSRTRRRFAPA